MSQRVFKVEYEFLESCSRKAAYQCDIVYGTNNEFGFDYLRDNMAQTLDDMSQRALNFAIVDEVDSILIDEARTPLIISAPAEEATEMYYKFADIVERLSESEDFNIDEKMRASTLTDAGVKKIEGLLGVENIYAEGGIRTIHHIEQALPVIKAIEKAVGKKNAKKKIKIVWLTPSGKQFDTNYAKTIANKFTDIVIVCGRYEGIDARVKKVFKVEEISVGPFVLTGGELPAMIMIDCIGRQIKGVLGDFNSLEETRVASSDVYGVVPADEKAEYGIEDDAEAS
jgi:predicted transcriptional regulator